MKLRYARDKMWRFIKTFIVVGLVFWPIALAVRYWGWPTFVAERAIPTEPTPPPAATWKETIVARLDANLLHRIAGDSAEERNELLMELVAEVGPVEPEPKLARE